MKAKSAKLGDVGVYAYVRTRGGCTFEGGNRRRVGAWVVSGELEKKEGTFLRKVGRCWRKADLFFRNNHPRNFEPRKYFAKLVARVNENAYL